VETVKNAISEAVYSEPKTKMVTLDPQHEEHFPFEFQLIWFDLQEMKMIFDVFPGHSAAEMAYTPKLSQMARITFLV